MCAQHVLARAGILLALAGALSAGDWPCYRGPNHDGISTETIRTNWATEPPQLVWKVALDPALSSLSVAGGRVFTMVKRPVAGQWQECAVALSATDGHELWATPVQALSTDLATPYQYPNGGVGPDDGPRSTPTVDGDRVYVSTAYLKLYCLNVTNGAVRWSRDFVQEYGSTVIAWQNAASPLVEGNLVFVNCNASGGRLLAVNKMTGSNVWRLHASDRLTQASPVATTIAGVRQVLFLCQTNITSVVPETGALLWRTPFSFNTSTGASPLDGGGTVYASAAYGVGAVAVRPSLAGTNFTAAVLWRKTGDLQNHWATPVHLGGSVYGLYNQNGVELQCVDLATGTERWPTAATGYGYGSLLGVGGNVLGLTEGGFLVLVAPSPAAYREIARFRAPVDAYPGQAVRCWNNAAVSNGRIYLRSSVSAVCLDVSVPKAPLELAPAPGSALPFRLRVSNAGGGSLPPDRLTGVEVLASTLANEPLSNWIRLSLPAVPTNGGFELLDLESTNLLRRFYQLRETN